MLSDVKAQPAALPFLQRIAEGRPSMPLLLVGDEGTGRRFASIQTAKEAFCEGTREKGCGCVHCIQIDHGIHPDFILVSPEGDKDIGIDAIRKMLELASMYPSMKDIRIFVLDGVDRLSLPAANALLKTLEEPSATTRFILLAEAYANVIPTIRSRVGKLVFRNLPDALVVSELQRFDVEPAKALVYARIADGSIGRALRLWGSGSLRLRDQVLTLLELSFSGDIPSVFSAIDTMAQALPQALNFLEQVLHDLLMVRTAPSHIINVDVTDRIAALAQRTSPVFVARFRRAFVGVKTRYDQSHINLPFHVKTLFAMSTQGN